MESLARGLVIAIAGAVIGAALVYLSLAGFRWTLADWAHLSELVLAGTAVIAASVGYWQLQTFQRFELLKLLEDKNVREARRQVWLKLHKHQPKDFDWWDKEEYQELESHASTVCASFDIVGLMASWPNRRFFIKHWAHGIRWTYKALEKYIDHRHSNGYRGYRRLYKKAKDQ